jgi:hypothetical protein
MSTYIDDNGNTVGRSTVIVSDEPRSAHVTYRNDEGKRFRVVVYQKPNPIGFAARLPGDRPK